MWSRFARYAAVEHKLRFPRYHIKDSSKVGLNTFLALLHDRLTPTMIRRTLDSYSVNIPIDRLIRVLSRYPNLMAHKASNTDAITEKSFALNFLQFKNIKRTK